MRVVGACPRVPLVTLGLTVFDRPLEEKKLENIAKTHKERKIQFD